MTKSFKLLRRCFLGLVAATLIPGIVAADEQTLDLDSHMGKVVVVDFWASWCVPCRRSFPWLNQMNSKYGDDGLVIIGVNLDHERAEADAFLQEYPADFRIYFDDSKDLANEFEVIAMPSSYLIGRDGEVVQRHYGFKVKKQEEYEAAIVAALRE